MNNISVNLDFVSLLQTTCSPFLKSERTKLRSDTIFRSDPENLLDEVQRLAKSEKDTVAPFRRSHHFGGRNKPVVHDFFIFFLTIKTYVFSPY